MLFWMCERRERQKTKTQKKGRGSGERTVTVTPGVEVSYGTPGSTGGVEVRWLELMAGSRSESVRGCVWCGGVWCGDKLSDLQVNTATYQHLLLSTSGPLPVPG